MERERLEARTDQGYQAIWRVGQGRCSVRERAREERSSPAAHHKMSQRDDEYSNSEEMDGERTSRQAAWQTEFVPSH
jgi:hypothetical protein